MPFCTDARDSPKGDVVDVVSELLASRTNENEVSELLAELKGLREALQSTGQQAKPTADEALWQVVKELKLMRQDALRGSVIVSAGGPKQVEAAVCVRRLYDVKTKDQTFSTRLLMHLRWEMPEGETPPLECENDGDWVPLWVPKLRVFGLVAEGPKEQLFTTETIDGIVYVTMEIFQIATISEQMELASFPTDCQQLEIHLQLCQTSSQAVLIPMQDGSPLCHLIEHGCMLDDFKLLHECPITFKVGRSHDKHKEYDMMIIRVRMTRKCTYYIVNVAATMFLLDTLVLCSWSVHPGNMSSRWEFDLSLILTAVAFKLILSDMLPKLSYLTVLDEYVLFGFLFLCLATVVHSIVPLIHFKKTDYSPLTLPPLTVEDEQALIDLDDITFVVFAGVWVLWNVAYALRFSWLMHRERRKFVDEAMKEMKEFSLCTSSHTRDSKSKSSLA